MSSNSLVFKKIKTLFSNPLGVHQKYKGKLKCEIVRLSKGKLKCEIVRLRRGILPIYGEDYDMHWNFTSFENKVVFDLGADYGSTAYYFLRKGALRIIAVEGDPQLASKLKFNSQRFKGIVPIQTFIDSSEKIEKLICEYHPDLVKVDIEGYEKLLTNIDVTKVKEWLIEAHSDEIYKRLREFFVSNQYNLRSFQYKDKLKILHCFVKESQAKERLDVQFVATLQSNAQ